MERIILDTDIASDVDDAVALALAMRSPEIKLEAVTTVYGDVSLRARLAKKLLRLGGRDDVPVYAGIEKPLLHNRDVWWGGHEGKGVLDDDGAIAISPGHAVDVIIDTIMSHPGEITLVPIGPLTNIAAAIIREPGIAKNVKQIVMMGGVARLADNGAEMPTIEHNIKCDPESASLVFKCGAPIVMVGLDVTMKVRIARKHQQALAASGKPLNEALAVLIDYWFKYTGQESTAMHDPLAVSTLIDSTVVSTRRMNVSVEYDHRHPTGQTVAVHDPEGVVDVALDVDNERFLDILLSRLSI